MSTNMETESVITVEKENQTGFYRLHTQWFSDKLKLFVASKDAAWVGEVTKENLGTMATRLEISPELFIQDCKDCLTYPDGKPSIVYAVDNGSFVWKKVEDEDTGMKVRLGAIPLEPWNFTETIQNMMTVALDTNKSLAKKVEHLTKQKNEAENNINKWFKKLEDCKNVNDKMENEMYSQFLLILNQKKKKICHLEEELAKTRAKNTINESTLRKQRKNTRSKKKKSEEKVISNDPYDDDTDVDIAEPSTSKEIVEKTATKRKSNFINVSNNDSNDSDATITDEELINSVPHAKVVNIKPNTLTDNKVTSLNESSTTTPPNKNVSPKKNNKLPKKNDDLLDFFFGKDSP